MMSPTVDELTAFKAGRCLEAIEKFRARHNQSIATTDTVRAIFLEKIDWAEWPYMGDLLMVEEVEAVKDNNLIRAIKLFRARTGKGLKDSKDIVEATVPQSMRNPKLSWDDEDLLRKGDKIGVIHCLRARYPGMGLDVASKMCNDSGLLPPVDVAKVKQMLPSFGDIVSNNVAVAAKETFDADQFDSREYLWGSGDMKDKVLGLLKQEHDALNSREERLKAFLTHLMKRVDKL